MRMATQKERLMLKQDGRQDDQPQDGQSPDVTQSTLQGFRLRQHPWKNHPEKALLLLHRHQQVPGSPRDLLVAMITFLAARMAILLQLYLLQTNLLLWKMMLATKMKMNLRQNLLKILKMILQLLKTMTANMIRTIPTSRNTATVIAALMVKWSHAIMIIVQKSGFILGVQV